MLLRIFSIFCTVLVVQIQANSEYAELNKTTEYSTETTVSDTSSTENNVNSTEKTTVNAPLVFPKKGFTTLNKTFEKLPTNVTNPSSNTKTTLPVETNEVSNEIRNATVSNLTESHSTTPKLPEQVTHVSSSIKPTDTEVSDLEIVPTKDTNDIDLLPVSPKINYSIQSEPDKTVLFIDNGENTEDEIKAQKSVLQEPHVALVQGQMAAILAGVFLCLSVVGYVGMLSWRRYLENRYGNREMLVNEFEFDEREDMKYFSI